MEVEWLEDFLAVSNLSSFSAAAEARDITQSALSRRIRSLEEWVGVPLFNRTTHKVTLCPAGESFRVTAEEVLRQLRTARAEAKERAEEATASLRFASTNALSLVFFPVWLRQLEATLQSPINVQLVANHMEACERIMVQGQAQFLLCHYHPAATTLLTTDQFRSVRVGEDVLMPVSVPKVYGDTEPLFRLPGDAQHPVPYLSYRPESGMGRIVSAVHAASTKRCRLRPTFTSQLAKLLVTMALDARGMAWLPKSLVDDYLDTGALVPAGDASWNIPIEIHLFRPRARQSMAAEQFWVHVNSLAKCGTD
ncbi:LysR family transcriptional regulator [Pararhizobium sp. DWP3-4]|uniref:LysR family transcriptional regulator n=1 Tax=Pararhizobium sp. DWP3-4 TaxID=2804565 RepID=UPI003CF504CA